ncbi:DDE-type integrase/transposase/recombinase [Belnapia sp. T6]|uniref:DDE-type integrase/transposase/recombinase n=1 Tax=Belnapia mucosa TaxID=2804532 RepID=A0ABS1VBH9_9PROT|nr:DDE-type integrase/transposase/recombinase [Belnapia mucosa]
MRVRGRWAYLYRVIDCGGNLADTMLSEHRDMAAAQAFFRSRRADIHSAFLTLASAIIAWRSVQRCFC